MLTSEEIVGAMPRPRGNPLDGALAAAIVDAAPMIVVLLDHEGRIDYANPFFEALVGRPLAEFGGEDWFSTFLPARDRDRARACFAQVCSGGEPLRGHINIILTASGDEREIEWHDPYRRGASDGPARLVGKDVTCERRSARAQRELEQRLANSCDSQGLYSLEPDGELRAIAVNHQFLADMRAGLRLKRILAGMLPFVGLFDLDGRVLELNREPVDAAGQPLADPRTLRCWELSYFCLSPELQDRIRGAIAQAAAGGVVQDDYPIHIHGHAPAIYELRFNPLLDPAGRVEGVICSGIDVTARRRIEDDLRIHSQVLMSMGEGVLFLDSTAVIRFTNPAIERMFGYDPGELLGQNVTVLNDADPAENRDITRTILTQLHEHGIFEGEFRNRRRDGTVFYTHATITGLERPGETLWVTIQEDVTERRAVEQEVRRTRDLLRQIIDASPDWIYVKDRERRFILVNQAFAAAQGLAPEAMVGRPDSDFFPGGLLVDAPTRGIRGFREGEGRALHGASTRDPELAAPIEQQRDRLFDTFKAPLRDQEGRPYGMLGHWRDVTREVEAAESLRRSLAEKETLLREIHHRVKNNLQIISSLLHFQAKTVKNPEDVAAFAEGRRRLLAMLLVHERLYQTKDLSQIELHGYIRALVRALMRSHDQGHVAIDTVVDEIHLPIELALPCGMILCELVTNIFKYAAGGRDTCHARVSARYDDKRVILTVDDDGVGFPAGFDPTTASTFGWSLIRDLVLQLDGTLVTRTARGAHVEITFSRPVTTGTKEPRT